MGCLISLALKSFIDIVVEILPSASPPEIVKDGFSYFYNKPLNIENMRKLLQACLQHGYEMEINVDDEAFFVLTFTKI